MSKNMLIISALTAMYTNNPSLQLMFPVLSEDLSFITFVKTIEKYITIRTKITIPKILIKNFFSAIFRSSL